MLTTKEAQIARWRNVLTPSGPIGKSKIVAAITCKRQQAPGIDKFTCEVFKCDANMSLSNEFCKSEAIQFDWKKGLLIKPPSIEDLSKLVNWLEITLLSTPSNVFSRVILTPSGRLLTASWGENKQYTQKDDPALTKSTHFESISNRHWSTNSQLYLLYSPLLIVLTGDKNIRHWTTMAYK